MKNVTNEEILAALKTIKVVCTESYDDEKNCRECPLGNVRNGECMVNKLEPISWVIGEPEVWKALL